MSTGLDRVGAGTLAPPMVGYCSWEHLRRPWWDNSRRGAYAAHDGELLFGVMRLGHMAFVAEPLRKPAHEGALT